MRSENEHNYLMSTDGRYRKKIRKALKKKEIWKRKHMR